MHIVCRLTPNAIETQIWVTVLRALYEPCSQGEPFIFDWDCRGQRPWYTRIAKMGGFSGCEGIYTSMTNLFISALLFLFAGLLRGYLRETQKLYLILTLL